jgi:hypothetical protein
LLPRCWARARLYVAAFADRVTFKCLPGDA